MQFYMPLYEGSLKSTEMPEHLLDFLAFFFQFQEYFLYFEILLKYYIGVVVSTWAEP